MSKLLRILLAVALTVAPIKALAQQFPTVASGTVIGRTQAGTGPAQAIPFATLIATMLASSPTIPTLNTSSILFAGSTSGTATLRAQAIAGTPTIQLPTGSGTLLDSVTAPLAATSAGNVSCPNCGIAISTRTAAAAQDLSAYSYVRTTGYATIGDGGGAEFVKTGGNFVDTRILTGSITNNGTGSCTNGTFYGTQFSGGTGRNAFAVVTVAGNVVTSIAMGGQHAVGYVAGDVLSATVTGCSTTVRWTVATVSAPSGSFTDSVGNKWQILYPAAGLDARSFGTRFDWDGSDGAATDNFTSLQNALSFASYPTSSITDLGGSFGGLVLLPKMSAMFCGGGTAALVIPNGVLVKGQGNYSTVLKPCDTWNVVTNVIELCDKNTHLACFGSLLQDLQVYMQRDVSSNSGVSLIYTNSAQHEAGLRNVVLYPGACRRAFTGEIGYGGATYLTFENVEPKGGKAAASCGGAANPIVYFNYGTTWVDVKNFVPSGLSGSFSGPRDVGLTIDGGFVTIDGFHSENIVSPIQVNIPTALANGQVRVRRITGGVSCVGLITLTGSNFAGNFILGPPNALNGCTRMVTNGQSGGSNQANPVLQDTIFNP